MKAKKLISVLLVLTVLVSSMCFSGMSVFAAENDENTSAVNPKADAAQSIDKQYAYNSDDLGANYTPEKTTFKVWSPTATKITVNLYSKGSDSEEGAANLGSYDLEKVNKEDGSFSGIWQYEVNSDIKNVYYDYTITTTDTTHMGSETTTTKTTQDVYSKATGVNGERSMVVDLDSTDPDGWENDGHVFLSESTDASIWEVHVKDFSYNENSGVSDENRGKFLGFTETGTTLNGEGKVATGVDYLKELGITTVHINPFYDFGSVDETGSDTQFNWGYDPVNYNVPEGSYSSNPYDGNVRIKECKEMVQALHNAGIQVVMDVVYNHTFSQDSCFQATVPDYYYRFTSTGAFSNGSGCGNETATERAMFRNYVIQSCLYWVNEYHIDGFRFDLMGCMDGETMNMIRAELDAISPDIIMYGEGWSGGTITLDSTTCAGTTTFAAAQSNSKKLSDRIGIFNDRIRDGIKGSVFESTGQGFIQGSSASAKDIAYGVRANTLGSNGWQALAPSQCVSYSSCHDNATLYDRLVNSTGKASLEDYRARYSDLVAMNKLAGAIELSSQGMNFMLAGEEMCRSKDGDENSYSSSATENMLDWSNLETFGDVTSYYKGMLQIRNAFSPITDSTNGSKDNYTFNNSLGFSTKCIAYTISNPAEGEWSKMAVIYNANTSTKKVTLKDTSVTDWVIIANDQEAGLTNLGEVTGSTFEVPATSALIAVEKSSFEASKITSDTSRVHVKYVDEKTGDVFSTQTLMGTNGTGYVTTSDTTIPYKYEVSSVEGEAEGTFGPTDKDVTYYYKDYVPESVKNADLNKDGKVDIKDVTMLQMYLVGMVDFDDEIKALADINYDGSVTIEDATMLQEALAGNSVAEGDVIVNYYNIETGEKIADSSSFNNRVGTSYKTEPKTVMAYQVNQEKYPENATGTYGYSSTTVVNYYYDFTGATQTLHFKYKDGSTTTPSTLSLWSWQTNVPDGKGGFVSVNLAKSGSWPGDTVGMTPDETGWATSTVDTPGVGEFNMILSVDGSPQTQDYSGFTKAQGELWVVVDGTSMPNQGDWLDIYDVNPDENPDATPLQ